MQLDISPGRVLSACLDTLAIGIVICTAEAKVIFANAASEMLTRGGGAIVLRKRGKVLEASGPVQTRALRQLIHDAARGRRSGAMNVTVRGDNVAGYIVLVKPLSQPSGVHNGGHAVVVFRPLAERASFSHDTLATLFSLSPTQAKLALALYDGLSLEGYAAERGIQMSTARTHLAHIFARTGVQSQRDLVRLLGTLPPVR